MNKKVLVSKDALANMLHKTRYDAIECLPFIMTENGYCYKNKDAYELGGDYICYIPEYCFDEDTMELDIDCCYIKDDFLRIAGKPEMARELFNAVDWQHPTSLWTEWEVYDVFADEN